MSFFFCAMTNSEIYTLSLHDALPIFSRSRSFCCPTPECVGWWWAFSDCFTAHIFRSFLPRADITRRHSCAGRSEEHTSELQSQFHLVCRLLLEKKKFLIYFFCYFLIF